jgi:DNA primase catalytic core
MKARLLNLEAATAAIKPFLAQYLQEHGIDTYKNFLCLSPKHTDSDPSMTIKQDPEHAYCFGCNQVADIFTAAHFLEDKPKDGKGWVDDNLLYLAKKFGVTVEMADLTQEEIYEYRTYRAYERAAEMVADPEFGDYTKVMVEIETRGWSIDRCAEWGIGTVDFAAFRERLKQEGFEPGFLDGVDLDRSNLFNNHNLIFTVYDDSGRPVGFSARNLKYKRGDPKAGPKYNNTRVTGLECNIFKKGERLYGFDLAKEAGSPLYVFEGQPDVVTARHHGVINCVCTLGTAFTDHHINLLKRHGLFNLVFVFDADEGGEKAIQKILDDKLSEHKDFRAKLIQLPAGMDPDQLLREMGPAEFARLKRWDAFEWRLAQFEEGANPEEVAGLMIPIILTDPNHLRHEKMARTLARHTGFELTTIMSEIKRRRDEKAAGLAQRKRAVAEDFLWKVKQNPDEADLYLTEARANIEDVERKFGQNRMAISTVLDFVTAQKEADEQKSGEFAGFFMKPEGLGGIGKRFNDDWKQDTWLCVGGEPQAGKTTFACQMAYEIAADERNNATVIYHSIDDAARFILFKMVCNGASDLKLTLGHVANPNYWMAQPGTDFLEEQREKGYQKVIKLIENQNLIIKDATDSSSLQYSENMLRYYRETLRDRNIILIIDNFHKLPDYAEIQGHERVKRISNHVKNMATAYHSTIITTVEYKKRYEKTKPSNVDIADSRGIAYDANAILHLHNDIHSQENGAQDALLVHEWDGELLPRIWVRFGKNKISGYEGREFIDLFPKNGLFRSVDLVAAERDQRARKQFMRDNKHDKLV